MNEGNKNFSTDITKGGRRLELIGGHKRNKSNIKLIFCNHLQFTSNNKFCNLLSANKSDTMEVSLVMSFRDI